MKSTRRRSNLKSFLKSCWLRRTAKAHSSPHCKQMPRGSAHIASFMAAAARSEMPRCKELGSSSSSSSMPATSRKVRARFGCMDVCQGFGACLVWLYGCVSSSFPCEEFTAFMNCYVRCVWEHACMPLRIRVRMYACLVCTCMHIYCMHADMPTCTHRP